MPDIESLLEPILRLHDRVREDVLTASAQAVGEELARVASDDEGDTIYEVDRVSERALVDFFERETAATGPIVLIAEGLIGGQIVLPRGAREADARWRVIVDPIDGTRGLMYQKRSAWVLTGAAPNRGVGTGLEDIELAVQTEIPVIKQHLADRVWAIKGLGGTGERWNRLTAERVPIALKASRAKTIEHGFAMVARFFPGARDELAAIDEEIVALALGPARAGKAHCFEDQYISSGGQLYELMAGRDRFVADLRPLMKTVLEKRRLALGICAHPYDLCTEMIAREMGVIVTGASGGPLRARLGVDEDVAWVGYANEHIRDQIEPLLRHALKRRGLL
jgi:fructose-1,6-bisphosphatase/inositol monophosphatase family enzyme